MKLIVGLGNPGEKYRNNRHNAGYVVVEYLERIGLPEGIVAKKTDTFMNDSGIAVSRLKNFYKVSLNDLYIAHDDLDIPLGQYKIQLGVGPKVHNGLISVEGILSDINFWRVRIGVDNRDPQNRVPGEAYVLQDFTPEEHKILEEVIKKASQEVFFSVSSG
ncbi:MAG: peptidyl-tRNA hydrolase, PTH1 family [Microgenomates group bacterium Gr01-1014_5]|nr:MAG: peptidyl-tRNA hydrolase, PTH1 family [Microgenomates group bacterium Gr01-1014_5]